jgi:predicted metal-dependent peptidase
MADAVKECIRIAATTAPGPHQGWWKSLAATIDVPAKVPWRKVYRGAVSAVSGGISLGCSDYSYGRRSRRQLLSKSQLPKMVDHEPEVCVVLDTSGSMNELMDAAVSETRSLLRCLGIEHIWLLQADTRVRSTKRVRLHTLSSVELVGGGGTSFDHALEEAGRLSPRPDFIVYITDGYGTIYQKPSIPTIFCLLGGGNAETLKNFGKIVEVTAD